MADDGVQSATVVCQQCGDTVPEDDAVSGSGAVKQDGGEELFNEQ